MLRYLQYKEDVREIGVKGEPGIRTHDVVVERRKSGPVAVFKELKTTINALSQI